MLMSLFAMLVRLAISCLVLVLKLALTLSALAGRLIGLLIVGLWRSWRRRRERKVQLRTPSIELLTEQKPALPPPASKSSTFTPRPMRPRPQR